MEEKDAIGEYGDVRVTFSSYYKYSFSYYGKAEDGAEISLSYGGTSDDIYRHEVENNESHTLKDALEWASYVAITRDGEEIFSKTSMW